MVALICLCAAFVGGFFIRGNVDFLTRLGFDTGLSSVEANPGMTVSGSTYDSLSARIAEVDGILQQSSIDSYDLDAATASVLGLYPNLTGDPSLAYVDQDRYNAYLSASGDTYRGIGVLFSENAGKAYAVDVFDGSEAQSKGVEAGDYVLSIDGDDGGDGWTQAEVVRAIDDAQGNKVVIEWRRPASLNAQGGDRYTVELEVSSYQEDNVETELDQNGVGYIKISQITSNSANLVKEAIDSLNGQGAVAYVLDLRGNPGGYLTQAVDIGSLFVKAGTFVQIATNESTLVKEVSGVTATDAPLVVLINGTTGAAAEVLAGGLQDNSRATLVGEASQGRGTVQSISQLSFGGGLRYTSARYLTPKGYEIEGVGINPDVQVTEDANSNTSQKEYAMGLALSMANGGS